MINLLVSALALAGAVSASPFPQNFCPAGCDVIVTEHPNPDPHQTYFFQQMTKPHSCAGNPGCEISKSEVEGNVVSFGASISGAGWISAGLEVSQYEESGEVQTCYGDPDDTICVFWRTASTMYTVNHQSNRCCLPGPYAPVVITSPNAGGVGSASICGRNEQCKDKGYSYWNNSESISLFTRCPILGWNVLTWILITVERQNGGVTVSGGPQSWPFGNQHLGIVPDMDEIPPRTAGRV
ncbi:hypothetical protein ACHAPB_002921 [Verticillium nonalfalfae]